MYDAQEGRIFWITTPTLCGVIHIACPRLLTLVQCGFRNGLILKLSLIAINNESILRDG
jgi:hypothetical protein